jgi:hypothetical protein
MQAAQADIAALMQTHKAAILKEDKAAEAALVAGAKQHSTALEKHLQKLGNIHAAYEAAIAAEWAEIQKTGKRQAFFLKVQYAIVFSLIAAQPGNGECLLDRAAPEEEGIETSLLVLCHPLLLSPLTFNIIGSHNP